MKSIPVIALLLPLLLAGACSSDGSVDGGDPPTGPAPSPGPNPVPRPIPPSPPSENGGADEEFLGPFPSWADAKRDFGLIGDGVTDDTAALQRALDTLGQTDEKSVLYLPAGTYRLTATLTMQSRIGIALIGEHPETTILRWDGPMGGAMLDTIGVAYSRFSRLTWDGSGTAGLGAWHRWDGSSNYFPVQIEHSDSVFQDMATCLQAGQVNQPYQSTATDSTVLRTTFRRCSDAAFRTNDFNSLLWIVADSLFEDNRRGIESWPGSVFVYRNVFRRSTDTDIYAALGPAFSARGNYSEGSATFFVGTDKCTFTLQGNVVVDATNEAVRTAGALQLALFDNVFRSNVGVRGGDGHLLSVGNVYASEDAFDGRSFSAVRRLDDRVDPEVSIDAPTPTPVWPRSEAPIVEVEDFTRAAIQEAIDRAGRDYPNQAAIVHLPAGRYSIDRTIEIPADSDLRLAGDPVGGSVLSWAGGEGGRIMNITGPSKVRLFDVGFGANAGNAEGLRITNADTVGGKIFAYMSGPNGFAFQGTTGYVIDGLDETQVHLLHADNMGARGGGLAVIGGPRTFAGESTPAQVNVYGGFMVSSDGPLYTAGHGGRLKVSDHWFESSGGALPLALDITDSAMVTIDGANVHFPHSGDPRPDLLTLSGVTGRFTFHGSQIGGTNFTVGGANPAQNVLLSSMTLGSWGLGDTVMRYVDESTAGKAATVLTAASYPFTEQGEADDAWLREMYAQLRGTLPMTHASPTPPGSVDVRLYRVHLEATDVGIRVQAAP